MLLTWFNKLIYKIINYRPACGTKCCGQVFFYTEQRKKRLWRGFRMYGTVTGERQSHLILDLILDFNRTLFAKMFDKSKSLFSNVFINSSGLFTLF